MKKLYMFILVIGLLFIIPNIAFAEGTDSLENNDTPGTATEAILPFDRNIKIDTLEDEDWFKIVLDRDNTLKTNFDNLDDSGYLRLDYEIYKELDDGSLELKNQKTKQHSSGFHDNFKLESGTHYICIKGSKEADEQDRYSNDEYRLRMELLPEYDPIDNSDWSTAYTYPLGEETIMNLNATNDYEWYKVDIDTKCTLKFKMSSEIVNSIYPDYAIYKKEEVSKEDRKPVYSRITASSVDIFNGNYKLDPAESKEYYICLKTRSTFFYDYKLLIDLVQEDESEDNDSWKNIKDDDPYSLGTEKLMTINAPNDEEWFKVKLDRRGVLKFRMDREDDSDYLYVEYEIYKEEDMILDNSKITHNRNASIYSYFQDNYKLDSGDYYIHLKGLSSSYYNGGYDDYMYADDIFKLNIELLPLDVAEFNDTKENPLIYPLGEEMNININAPNDEAWFEIDLSEKATLKSLMEINEVEDGKRLPVYYELFTKDEALKENPEPIRSFHSYLTNSTTKFVDYWKLKEGKYYMKFYHRDACSSSYDYGNYIEDKFKIKFDLLPEDELEDNDSWEDIDFYPLGEEKQISISASNDVEWFKVDFKEKGTLQFNLNFGEDSVTYKDVDLYYDIYSEDEMDELNPLVLPDSKHPRQQDMRYGYGIFKDNWKLDSGTYYIRLILEPRYSRFNGDNKAILKIEQLPEDEMEDNDTIENIEDYPLGEEKLITINASNDIDWFKISVEEETDLKIRLEGTNMFYRDSVTGYVYSEENLEDEIKGIYINRDHSKREITTSIDTGTYYLKVEGYSQSPLKLTIYTNDYDATRPTISSTSPNASYSNPYNRTANYEDVYSNIEISFSKAIDRSTLNKDNITFSILDEPVDFDIKYIDEENKLIITPSDRLNYSSEYVLTLSDNIKAADNGMSFLQDYVFNLNTRDKRIDEERRGTITGKVNITDEFKNLASLAKVYINGIDVNYSNCIAPDIYGNFAFEYIPEGSYSLNVEIPMFLSDSNNIILEAFQEEAIELNPIFGDLNCNGVIDIFDLVILSKNYGNVSR